MHIGFLRIGCILYDGQADHVSGSYGIMASLSRPFFYIGAYLLLYLIPIKSSRLLLVSLIQLLLHTVKGMNIKCLRKGKFML